LITVVCESLTPAYEDAYKRKIAGRLCISGLSFFHSFTDLVLMNSLSLVKSTAMQIFVDGWQLESNASNNWLLRYGVSINIWVQFFFADSLSNSLIALFLSGF
jgi:hypothetical protein